MSLIALATDFGNGLYVGEMKAVILSRAPRVRVVDLFHDVAPQGVLEGAFLLSKSWRFFPENSIFVCVIDPGVGGDRRILALRAYRRTFLAPDNGLLSFIPDTEVESLRAVRNRRLFLPEVSRTFHGRDIFSPVAAALARRLPLARVGPGLTGTTQPRIFLPSLSPRKTKKGWVGSVVHVDRFGNVVTNLDASSRFSPIRSGRRVFRRCVRTYADAPLSRPVALKGAFGTWEIAVRNGNAARQTGLRLGSPVGQENP